VGDTGFLRRLVQAVSGQEDWEVLISLGGKLQWADLLPADNNSGKQAGAGDAGAVEAQAAVQDLPANVHAFRYVPQLKVLAVADLSINHGGIHTIHECLHFGVPMLVYSGKRSDQPGCAARVHYHGIGLMADKDEDDSDAIQTKINAVITGAYASAVQKMQHRIAHYQQDKVLEQLVGRLLTRTNES